MDAYSTDQAMLDYSEAAPVFVAGSTDAAIAQARTTVSAFGLRVAGGCSVADAAARLDQQGRASAVWLELGESSAEDISRGLLDRLNSDVRGGRYGAVVSAPRSLIDPLAAVLADDVQLLIDADEAERASALAISLARTSGDVRISDVASDRSA